MALTATPYVDASAARATARRRARQATPSRPRACGLPPGPRPTGRRLSRIRELTARRGPAANLRLRVGSPHEVAFVPFRRAPMFVIGAAGGGSSTRRRKRGRGRAIAR